MSIEVMIVQPRLHMCITWFNLREFYFLVFLKIIAYKIVYQHDKKKSKR